MPKPSLFQKISYARNDWRRKNRILFPSPAEVKFVRIMGGHCITISFINCGVNKFPLTIIVSFGKFLRREYVQREVRVGAMYVDFGFITPFTRKGIEIDGQAFHRDIVREQNRDDYLRKYGWKILHIQAIDLYRNPKKVKKSVISFLSQ